MPDSLSNDDIAVLSDIAQLSIETADSGKREAIARLCREGFIERDPETPSAVSTLYRLTGKAEALLSERGAGLNEA